MNIIFFTRRFYPAIGGVEKHVFELSKRLLALGHSITIITEKTDILLSTKSISKQDQEFLKKIKIYRIPVSNDEHKKKFEIWRWLFTHRSVLQRAEIIHAHDVFFWYLPFRFLYPRKKVFTTFHGYEGYPITRKAIVVRKISEVLSRGNICIGAFIKKWYGTRPDYVSYGAVKVFKKKYPISNVKYQIPNENRESAVFVGRLDDQTGIETYCDAFRLIKKKLPKFEFLVIGDGEFEKKLSQQIQHKEFDPNASQYFKDYRFAFVSRYLSILEAMAAKRLVVAVYDNPIKKDYLTMSPMAAFMVIAHTPEEIADAVNYYILHPKNEKDHIEKAYAWAKEQTWEKMTETYLVLWSK